MAYCTKCGTVMHPDDMGTHICNPADIPDKGKPIPKGKTKAEVL